MQGKNKLQSDPQLRLIDQVRKIFRHHHYSYPTEKTYYHWIIRFLQFYISKSTQKRWEKRD